MSDPDRTPLTVERRTYPANEDLLRLGSGDDEFGDENLVIGQDPTRVEMLSRWRVDGATRA